MRACLRLVRDAAMIASTAIALACGCTRSIEARAEGWYDARTAHVHLQTDGGEDRALASARRFETLHQALATVFFHCDTSALAPLDVTVLSNEDEYDALVGHESSGVFFHDLDGLAPLAPRVVIPAASLEHGADQVFLHELTHRFIDACFATAPTWLHEGLASVFETVTVEGSNVRFGQPRYRINDMPYGDVYLENGSMVAEIPSILVPSASQVRAMSTTQFYAPPDRSDGHSVAMARSGNYAGAFALAYYLALGPDAATRARFIDYLSSLSAGTERQENAFELAFYGIALDGPVLAYMRARPSRLLSRPFPGDVEAPPVVVSITSAEAHLRLAELDIQTAGSHSPTSATLAHLEIAAADPTTRPRALLLRAALANDPAAFPGVEAAGLLAPSDLDILRARTMIASRAGDAPTAQRLAAVLAARVDARSVDLIIVADVERAAGQLDEAYAHARAAVHMSRSSDFAWFELGRVAFDRADLTLARRAMRLVQNLATHGRVELILLAREWIRRIDRTYEVPRSPTDPAYVAPTPTP